MIFDSDKCSAEVGPNEKFGVQLSFADWQKLSVGSEGKTTYSSKTFNTLKTYSCSFTKAGSCISNQIRNSAKENQTLIANKKH